MKTGKVVEKLKKLTLNINVIPTTEICEVDVKICVNNEINLICLKKTIFPSFYRTEFSTYMEIISDEIESLLNRERKDKTRSEMFKSFTNIEEKE